MRGRLFLPLLATTVVACSGPGDPVGDRAPRPDSLHADMRVRPEVYTPVRLTVDLSVLEEDERRMIPLLVQAAMIMDSLYWRETWGVLDSIPSAEADARVRRFFRYNYGPWDRLAGNAPFIDGVGRKPKGARFYPADMTLKEFEAWTDDAKDAAYTMVRRDGEGQLQAIPFHVFFSGEVERAAKLLERAAALTGDPGLENFLRARATALRTDKYGASDRAWMDLHDNHLDVVIGPIETYEDGLLGLKAAHQAYVLVKDPAWSASYQRYAALLPALQQDLPVAARYKPVLPHGTGRYGVYDVVFNAGASNCGGKALGLNLPNDEGIRRGMGIRSLQLRNVVEAKYERILVPIADVLVAADQRRHVTFDAFFRHIIFQAMAHRLGVPGPEDGNVNGHWPLEEEAQAVEMAKADILALYMAEEMRKKGEITEEELIDHYVCALANTFRSVRYGAGSAHGRAHLLLFNFLMQAGAFVREQDTGTYRVVPGRMHQAITELAQKILHIQGDCNLAQARDLMGGLATKGARLQQDLGRIREAHIPIELVFEQGLEDRAGKDVAR